MNRKHDAWKVIVLVFCAALFAAPGLAGAAEHTLNYGSTATPNSLRGIAEEMFLKEVETLTGGQVAFNRSWGGGLVDNQEVLQAVQDGIIDVGQVNPNFYPKQLIANNAFALLMQLPVDYMRRMKFFDDCLASIPDMTREIERFNQKLVYNYTVTHYAFISGKPLTKVEDLKGRKTRAAARWLLSLLREVKATPVSIPLSDTPMSFQTNALDVVMLSVDATDMTGMLEVAPHALLVREFPVSTPYYMTINADTFNALPADIQAKFREAAVSTREKFAQRYNQIYQEILDKWSTNPKYHVSVADPEFIRTWISLDGNRINHETWIKEAQSAGMKDSRQVLEAILKICDASLAEEAAATR